MTPSNTETNKTQAIPELDLAIPELDLTPTTFWQNLGRNNKTKLLELLKEDYILSKSLLSKDEFHIALLKGFIDCRIPTSIASSDPSLYKFLINMQTKFMLSGYYKLSEK